MVSQTRIAGSAWQGPFVDLAKAIQHIQRAHLFGRLSLRNQEHAGIAHLYFRAGKLVHVVGHRGDARAILFELQNWRQGTLRFDQGVVTTEVTLNEEHERILAQVLIFLAHHSVIAQPPPIAEPTFMAHMSQVIEGNVVATLDAKSLISPNEWRVLVEGTRRVSLAVAHLVGPLEALRVLRDILDDCATSFPAFANITIASSGYLQVTDHAHLDLLAREALLEGFGALFSICQYFCAPIIGERDAHHLLYQSLRELTSPLTRLGVFRVDHALLARSEA